MRRLRRRRVRALEMRCARVGDALRVRWRCVVRDARVRCECMAWGGEGRDGWMERWQPSGTKGSGLRDSGCGLRGDRVGAISDVISSGSKCVLSYGCLDCRVVQIVLVF